MEIRNQESEDSIKNENQTDQNEIPNTDKPTKRIRRKATPEQLSNPFHGVKLVQILERLVDYYGWEYLGERVNIRCFKHNPTMKSSLGFLRRTTWAREFVEDVYLEMLEDKELDELKKNQRETDG